MKVANAAASSPAHIGTVAKRNNTLLDLGQSVPQVPTQFFTDANGILPRLKDGTNIQEVVKRLEERGHIVKGRWARYDSDPSGYRDIENTVFRDIRHIADDIREASGILTPATLIFRCNPDMSPDSSTRPNNHTKPDAYGILADPQIDPARGGRPRWIDVAVPGEFKKSAKNDQDVDNWSKIIWSMTHIMQEDARRRFVIAFSIEDTDMRMWLASRSEVLVSMPFNWITKCELTVEFFLRLMYAEEVDLGWDPTMQRLSPRDHVGDVQYLIECADAKYRTTRLISDIGAEAIRGRGTRVWEVREVKDNNEEDSTPLVLKDSWVDSWREREGTILASIREAAKELGPDAYDFDKYFMRAKAYSDVYIGNRKDDTHLLIRGRPSLDGMEVKPLVIKAKTPTVGTTLRSNAGVTGAPQLPEDAAPEPVNYSAKIHHRIVFTEVGTTIAEVDSLVDALIAMVGATKALYTLHRCGWVHRDISVGNILVVNGRGKLTDVEYAKKESKVTSHDGVRTGTLFFMSPEVENQRYIYNEVVAAVQGQLEGAQSTTNCHTLEEESEALVASILLARRKASGAAKPPVPPQDATSVHDKISIPFKHNPLHDLESMIWVVIWLFVCSKFVKPTNPKLSEDEWASILDSHAKFSKRLFRDEGFRRDAMTTDGTLLDGFDTTLPQLLNPAKELDAVRVKLIAQFVAVHKQRKQTKAQVPFEDMISPDLHTTIIKFLERVALDLANADEDLAINVSAWAEQRKNMRDLVVDDAPTTSTRRTSNALQDGASQSRKRPKTHRGQSATAARPYSLPSGPSGGTRLRARMNQVPLDMLPLGCADPSQ